jgi:integrase
MPDYLTHREGFWHYARRVPHEFADIDRRGIVKQSTKIRVAEDPKGRRAARVAAHINAELEGYWRGLVEGRAAEAERRYQAARKRARALGFEYTPAAELATLPVNEILARLDVLVGRRVEEETEVAAVLGGEAPPEIMLSELFDKFEELMKASNRDLSPDQLRKWRNPKKRALANLISVVKDKPLARVTRGDAQDFRAWWQDRVLDEGLEIGTANKDFSHLGRMFRKVNQQHQLGLGPIFAEMRIEGETFDKRAAFRPEFVQDRLLATGALAGLNGEARAIIYLMAETGLRLSEAANLDQSTIVLDGEVPHVQVRANGRRLKTKQSERDIPLVGVALMVAQAFPDGFPRYRDRGAGLSATVNKFLRENGLLPSEEHSLYSLRHTFKDRLRAVEAPEEMIDRLMGHKTAKPDYGSGHELRQKRRWLEQIAFRPPGHL